MIYAEGCQAEFHHPDCPCPNCLTPTCNNCPFGVVLTTDHFTPRAIRREWRILPNGDGINDRSNTIKLNIKCHRIKDRSTPDRVVLEKRRNRGKKSTTLEDYQKDVLPQDLRDYETGEIINPNGRKVRFKKRK